MMRDLMMTTDAREADSVGSLFHREREPTEFAAKLRALMLALLIPALPLASGSALAQPSQKPIQIIVPFAPGASADGAARIVANELGPRLRRQVVVEHRAGAGGALGLQMLAKAAPDGDTLGVGATGALLLNPNLPTNPGPDLLRELTPVAKLIDVAIVLVANPSTGPKSIAEMIERSKTTPGGLTYGSTGTNTSQHLSIELLKRATGANLVHVPYRGSAPAVVDLIAGQIPLASVDLTSAYPHVQAGKLTALGLIDGKRFAAAPEIPTIAESGVPGFGRASGFIGLFAPAGTPAPIVKKLSQEVAAILAMPAAQAAARTLTSATAYEDDATFARFLAAESVKWKQALSSLDLGQ
jgi:tripartite-type tricarboxylate transporter receptor subunit TctC